MRNTKNSGMTFEERLDPALLETYEASPEIDLGRNIPKLRFLIERYEAPLRAALPPIPEVTVTDHLVPGSNGNPDVRVRTYEPEGRAADSAAIFWIHGGGMVIGTIDGDDFMCKTWARDFGCLVASVDYRLAPEHQYPAHIDDCYTGLQWFHTRLDDYRVDRSRLVIGGASAGGGLAAGTALLARDRGEVPLCFQYLVYPMIDDRDATASTHEITTTRAWGRRSNQIGWRSYLGDRVGGDDVPLYAAPARAEVDDLRGLSPAYIDVGELDPFRDEDIAYASRLLAAGVSCELHVTPGAFHGSEMAVPDAPSSRRIRAYRRDALSRALA
jgi:acetyl esterase/lipase